MVEYGEIPYEEYIKIKESAIIKHQLVLNLKLKEIKIYNNGILNYKNTYCRK